jgi:tripartite-type tricarboxylate transporter receptor subunit TctC
MKRLLLCAAALMGLALSAQAQNWPERPIKLIVPTGAGSATDVMARLLANEVQRSLNGSIYVENVAGNSGLPAHQAASRAAPDGYTFLFTNTSGLALNAVAFKQLPYDPVKDFTAVAVISDLSPQMLSVHKDVAVRTLPEFIAWVKANPGKVSYGYDITAGASGFQAKLLNRRAGLDMADVPYRVAPQLVQDAAAARFPVLVSSITVAKPFMDTGDLRPVAMFSGRRFPTMPNVATVGETIPGASVDGWFVVVAPAGTPAAMVEKFNAAVAGFLKIPSTEERMNGVGLSSSGPRTVADSAAFIAREQQRWREIAKEIGIEAQ